MNPLITSSPADGVLATVETGASSDARGSQIGAEKDAPLATALLVRHEYRNVVFSPALIAEIDLLAGAPARWVDPTDLAAGHDVLAAADVLFATWGTPKMDEAFLAAAPRLKAIFYAAGSPKAFLTPAVFERGITVCIAAAANAVPVADFTVGTVLLSLKQVWQTMRTTRQHRSWIKPEPQAAGTYQSRVGLVSLGVIGRRVAQALAAFDLQVLAYDPHIYPDDALTLGVKPTSLEEIFATCDVVVVTRPPGPMRLTIEDIPVAAKEAFCYDPSSESFRHASGHVLSLQRITALDISAAAIRAHVAAGRSIGFLVPAAVETYIEAHRLYRPGDVTR